MRIRRGHARREYDTAFAGGNLVPVSARLFDIANNSTGDGNRLFFALNVGTNLQFGVNQAGGTGQILGAGAQGQGSTGAFGPVGGTLNNMTNNWLFVGASYTTALNGTVNLYVGSQSVNASLVGSLTNVGTILWDASGDFACVANRASNGQRALPGSVDDVRLYDGAGDLAFMQGIQNVPEPTAATLIGLGGLLLIGALRRKR